MITVLVEIKVKKEFEELFIKETMKNLNKSQAERGIIIFELLKKNGSEYCYILIEVYLNKSDIYLHKQTRHYQKWKKSVDPMMETKRLSASFSNVS